MKKYVLTAVAFILFFSASAQWIQQNAGFTNDTLGFYEMSLPNRNTAWAVCFDIKISVNRGRYILDFTRTTDGGATWIPGKMGTDHTLQFANISAINEKEAWVAMNKRFVTGGGLYHTTNGGVTWQKSNPDKIFNENSYPNFVHFSDKNKGITMGDPNDGYFEVYTTTNGGKKWKRVPSADLPAIVPGEYGWISGFAALDKTVWFGTSAGRMYKTTNFGKDWTVHTVDPAGKFVMEIAFNDDMLHGVAHLRDNANNTFLYSTADGGVTWTDLGQPANWKSSRITAVPGTNALVSTGINNNPAFRGSAISYDNGTTWTEIENTVSKTVSRFYDAETGYACGAFVTGPPFRGGIFKSAIVFQAPSSRNKNGSIATSDIQQEKILDDATIKVFPMPANNVVNIALPGALANTASVVRLLSMDGKVIEERRSKASNSIQVNVSKLTPGMYVINVTSNNKTVNQVFTVVR